MNEKLGVKVKVEEKRDDGLIGQVPLTGVARNTTLFTGESALEKIEVG